MRGLLSSLAVFERTSAAMNVLRLMRLKYINRIPCQSRGHYIFSFVPLTRGRQREGLTKPQLTLWHHLRSFTRPVYNDSKNWAAATLFSAYYVNRNGINSTFDCHFLLRAKTPGEYLTKLLLSVRKELTCFERCFVCRWDGVNSWHVPRTSNEDTHNNHSHQRVR